MISAQRIQKKHMMLCSLACTFLFNTAAMEKYPTAFLLCMRQLLSTPIEPIQEPLRISFLKQSLEITKDISVKLLASCYNHPKIFIGATTMTLLLISFKRSPLWPTKHDLKKFKRENTQKAEEQLKQFLTSNNQATHEATTVLASTIVASQAQLMLLHDELGASEAALTQAPKEIKRSFTVLEAQESTHQNALFAQANVYNAAQLNNLEAYADGLMQKDELIVSHYLEQFLNQTSSLEKSQDSNIENIMLALAHEAASLHDLTHNYNHQETLHLSKLHQSMNNQHENLTGRVDAIIFTLAGLIDTQPKDSSCKKIVATVDKKQDS